MRYNLAINRVHHLWICTDCEVAFFTPSIAEHTSKSKAHPDGTAPTAQFIATLAGQQNIASIYPDTTHIIDAIDGLRVQKVTCCSACRTFGVKKKTITNHISALHKGLTPSPKPQGTYNAQYFNNSNKAFFEVNVRNVPPPPAPGGFMSLLHSLRNFDISNLVDKTETDARLVQPWLKINGFHLHVAPYDIAEIRALVALPSKAKDLPRLSDAVLAYFKKAEAALKSIDRIILCKLNTSDIAKTSVNQFIESHKFVKVNSQAYCMTVTHLVAGLLRASVTAGYKFPTNPSLDTAIKALDLSLQKPAERCFNELHAIFLALFGTTWMPKEDAEEGDIANPTMCFLALFALKADGEFLQPITITAPIRHLTWSIEFTMVVEINARVKAKTAKSNSDAYDQLSEYVQEKMPELWWPDQEDPTRMLFNGQPVTLQMYREICVGLITKLVKMWDEEILLGLKNIYADHSAATDNLRSTKPKYSFIHDASNNLASVGKDFLTAIFDSPKLRERFTQMLGSEHVLKKSECLKWLQALAEFEGGLMVLIHLSSGGPGRGTEITNLLAENTATRVRNLFLFGNRHVTIVRNYTKDNNISQKDRYIPMGLDAVTGDLLVQLHSVARPLAVHFSIALDYEDSVTLQYQRMLFMGLEKPFTSKKLTTLLKKHTSPITRFDIGIADFRQIFVGFRERNLGKTHNLLLEDSDSADTIEAEQMGHSRATEKAHYGLSSNAWDGASDEIILLFLKASSKWQVLLELVPGGLQLPYHSAQPDQFQRLVTKGLIKLNKRTAAASTTPVSVDTTQLQNQIQEMRDDFNAKQSEFSAQQSEFNKQQSEFNKQQSETNQLLTALIQQNTESTKQLNAQIEQLSHQLQSNPEPDYNDPDYDDEPYDPTDPHGKFIISHLIHQLMFCRNLSQFTVSLCNPSYVEVTQIIIAGSIRPDEINSSRLMTPADISNQSTRINSSRLSLPVEDILFKLRELLKDPNANWTCPEQREAVQALLNLEHDVIVAMRTATGKSLVFILAALLQRACSVLFIPLRALLEDWKRRLDNFGIPYHHFHADDEVPDLTGEHNIILVSSDVGRFRNWEKAVDTLNTHTPVARIAFDESQLYMGDTKFRQFTFANPDALRRFPCQMVLLSGSAPPHTIPAIVKTFGLLNPIVIRTHTARLETMYRLGPVTKDVKDGHNKIQKLVSRMRNGQEPGITWGTKDRYIVYVQSLHDGYELADLSELSFYHGTKSSGEHKLTEQQQAEMWDDWVQGYKIGLICTSALQAGIDYPHIRLVVHLKQPRSMNDFIQESARATRDGKLGISLILPFQHFPNLKDWSDEHQRLHGTAHMQALTKQKTHYPFNCFHYQMGNYNDGTTTECAEYEGAMLCSGCVDCE
ncbi:hypothetical protein C8J56DRAFT_802497 [Mycena floridula]|nr:hypothetical protein C8J56DRAFT_802497 [Mycena floridula]